MGDVLAGIAAAAGVLSALLLVCVLRRLQKLPARPEEQPQAQQQLALAKFLGDELERARREAAGQQALLREELARQLELLRGQNAGKLEEIRRTVDEKLTATLGQRLNASFQTVSEQLANVYRSLGEVKELSAGVTSSVTGLNRVLSNVKTRGTWAEVQLESILDQILPGQYEKQACVASARERVDFALRIPAGENLQDTVYLPIDAKFPLEDYTRLCLAAEAADAAGVQQARRALEAQVVQQARSVAEKYIHVPRTTPYAILYLATEGLYGEVLSSPAAEQVKTKYSVILAGPTTVTALLTSLAMGFKALTISKKTDEVRQTLRAVSAQYDKFTELLVKAGKQLGTVQGTIGDALFRNEQIQKKLKGYESLDAAESEQVLQLTMDPE